MIHFISRHIEAEITEISQSSSMDDIFIFSLKILDSEYVVIQTPY